MSKILKEETFCCGYKRCPSAKLFDDGHIEVDDIEAGLVGAIRMSPEQALALAAWIKENVKP